MDNTGTIQVLMERKKEAQSQWYPMLESSTASTYNGSFWIVKLDREKIIYVPIKVSPFSITLQKKTFSSIFHFNHTIYYSMSCNTHF